MLDRERTHQANFQHADFLALRSHIVHCLVDCFRARTHDDDDVFGIGRADVFKQSILAADDRRKLVHRVLHNGRAGQVVGVDCFASLEIHVRILRRAAQHRMVRRQGALTMRAHQVVIDHGAHIVEAQLFDLGNFMRGAEAVKEVQEGNARFQRRGVRHQRQVHGFLDRVGREQRKTGLAGGHHILVIAKDRQRLRRHGASRHVDHGTA